MRYAYPVQLTSQHDGRVLALFNDVPEALTDGANIEEALAEAQDALVTALGGYVQARRMIPRPSRPRKQERMVALPPLWAAKLALYQAMREQGVSNVALGERLELSEGAIRRLVSLDHRSHMERVERALHELGKHLVVEAA